MLRHGSRLPSNKQVSKASKFLKDVRDYYEGQSGSKPKSFDTIQVGFAEDSNYRLSDLGAFEMRTIGNRFKQRFSDIFNIEGSTFDSIDLVSSDRDRSKQSALNFLHGVYDFQSNSIKIAENLFNRSLVIDNKMMRTFDECKKYVRSVKQNVSAIQELLLFKTGKEMRKLLSDLKERHNIQDFDLDPGQTHFNRQTLNILI